MQAVSPAELLAGFFNVALNNFSSSRIKTNSFSQNKLTHKSGDLNYIVSMVYTKCTTIKLHNLKEKITPLSAASQVSTRVNLKFLETYLANENWRGYIIVAL